MKEIILPKLVMVRISNIIKHTVKRIIFKIPIYSRFRQYPNCLLLVFIA